MTVLVIAEHDNVSLHAATRHAVGAARLCGGDVHLLQTGTDGTSFEIKLPLKG